MWVIWVKKLLPPALNRCPKCKKSANLVTLGAYYIQSVKQKHKVKKLLLSNDSKLTDCLI